MRINQSTSAISQQVQLLGPNFRNGMVKRVKLRQSAKFRGDRSNRRRDVAIKMVAAAVLDF